jgi:hypothetical protein
MVVVTRGAPMAAPDIEQPALEMVSADPMPAPLMRAPSIPGRRTAMMSTDRTVAYVTATML